MKLSGHLPVVFGFIALLAALVGVTPLAHAESEVNAETAFLTTLDEAGIEYTNPQEAIAVGREVCDYLHAGHPPHAAARALRISNHHLSVPNAARFVTFARSAFCPAGLAAAAGLVGSAQEGPR